jgi:hypothetical protein
LTTQTKADLFCTPAVAGLTIEVLRHTTRKVVLDLAVLHDEIRRQWTESTLQISNGRPEAAAAATTTPLRHPQTLSILVEPQGLIIAVLCDHY